LRSTARFMDDTVPVNEDLFAWSSSLRTPGGIVDDILLFVEEIKDIFSW